MLLGVVEVGSGDASVERMVQTGNPGAVDGVRRETTSRVQVRAREKLQAQNAEEQDVEGEDDHEALQLVHHVEHGRDHAREGWVGLYALERAQHPQSAQHFHSADVGGERGPTANHATRNNPLGRVIRINNSSKIYNYTNNKKQRRDQQKRSR